MAKTPNIGIFSQVLFQETIEIICDLLAVVENKPDFKFFMNPELYKFVNQSNPEIINQFREVELEDMDVDCIISIGGDGTILRIARTWPEIPILSINKGRKGFMTEIEPSDVKEKFKEFIDGKFKIKEHTCVEASVNNEILGTAINEFVITSVDLLKPIDFRVLVDEVVTSVSLADGLIVSTAIGSTGHSLSSGGAVVDADLKNLQISWINPINLAIRPLILGSHREIKIRCATRINLIKVVIDGQRSIEFSPPIELTFRASKKSVKFYRKRTFMERLRQHLHPEVRDQKY